LVVWCKQLAGAEPDEPGPITRFIRNRQRPDGGFAEIDAMRHGGTNPTAAAVALLGGLDAPEDAADSARAAAKFIAGMQTGEGGLRANARIPVADLLSTFTGLVALAALDSSAAVDSAAARKFVLSLEQPAGGFRAGAWDQEADVEYTFYGLGSLAMLSGAEP
jgi:geranylgeranyl transferase type-2 subunit beta